MQTYKYMQARRARIRQDNYQQNAAIWGYTPIPLLLLTDAISVTSKMAYRIAASREDTEIGAY